MSPPPAKILLVDDHEVVRSGLRALLAGHEGVEICGEAKDGRMAVQLVRETHPDIVVMDISMPELNGLEATRQILDVAPKTAVLILSVHHSLEVARKVVDSGARGYVLKSDSAGDLRHAIETLRQNASAYTARITEMLPEMAGSETRRKVQPVIPLTPREREIFQLLAEGKSNKGVALALGITVKTAETHRARVMRKLRVDSVAALVRYAIRNQVIEA